MEIPSIATINITKYPCVETECVERLLSLLLVTQKYFTKYVSGEDGDIYCKLCYGRKFAPVGYRGGCSSWVDNDSINVLRHSFQAF